MKKEDAQGIRSGGRFGRQVEAERNDALVLEAARAVFAEQGADAPVSAIAERAGVGIGTLYRRYGSKEQLIQRLCAIGIARTISDLSSALDADGTGWDVLARYMTAAVDARVGAFAPLAGTFTLPPEVTAANSRAQALAERLLHRGHTDGTVRPDVTTLDITHAIEMFSRYPRRTPHDDHARHRLLALTFEGLRPSPTPLPGPHPDWEDYRHSWADPKLPS